MTSARTASWRPTATAALLVVGALLVLLGLYVNGRIAQSTRFGVDGDLGVYRAAAREYLQGANPYLWLPVSGQGGFIYPPFGLILALPLAAGSGVPVAAGWAVLTLVILALTLVATTTRDSRGVPRRWVPVALAVVLLWSLPLQNNMLNGQVSMVIACLMLWDLAGPVGAGGRWRGVAGGLAASIKLTPLIVLPWLAVTRQWRAVGTFLVTCLVCGLIGLSVGPGLSRYFLTEVIGDTGSRSFVGNDGNRALRGTIAQSGLSDTGAFLVWVAVAAVVTGAAYWYATRAWRRRDRLGAACILGCASLLVSPVSWTNHNLWVPLLVAVLWQTGRRGWQAAGWVLAACLVGAQQWAGLVEGTALGWTGGGLLETGTALAVCLAGVPRQDSLVHAEAEEDGCAGS